MPPPPPPHRRVRQLRKEARQHSEREQAERRATNQADERGEVPTSLWSWSGVYSVLFGEGAESSSNTEIETEADKAV
jgi:hypothetical protein